MAWNTLLVASLAGTFASPAPASGDDLPAIAPSPAVEVQDVAPEIDVDPEEDFVTVELATVGFDTATRQPVILFRDPATGETMPIWVGIAEAQAIVRVLQGVEMPRPMTHDLLADVLRRTDATVDEVVVHDLRDGTYFGLIRLSFGDGREPLEVDSRPSDATALAVRVDAPIRVKRSLLRDAPDVDVVPPEAEDQVVRAMGLTVVDADERFRDEYDLPDRNGLVVIRAEDEGAAAGLRAGDLIVEINGEEPRVPMDLLDAVRESEPGEPVILRYWRDGSEEEIRIYPAAEDPEPRRTPVT